jgi:hypothetical protein
MNSKMTVEQTPSYLAISFPMKNMRRPEPEPDTELPSSFIWQFSA